MTERRLLEEELRQALNMEAIGKLKGGLRTTSTTCSSRILGHSDLLPELVRDRPEAAEHVHEIRRAGERAAELVRQLFAFGRKQQLLPRLLDLNQLTLEMQKRFERLIGEDVALVPRLAEGTVPIKADRSQIEQVLLNLAANARDAMPAGGYLTVQTKRVHLTCADMDVEQELPDGEYAVLSVSDTGKGMVPGTLELAFDPFFTTKEAGKGAGLGLATVYGIVKQSGGAVSLHSSVGHGTLVEILRSLTSEPLPVPAVEETGERAVELVPVAGQRSSTILVAEEEEASPASCQARWRASGVMHKFAANVL